MRMILAWKLVLKRSCLVPIFRQTQIWFLEYLERLSNKTAIQISMYNLIMYLCFCFQIYTSYIHDPIDAPNMYRIKKHKQQIIQILD
jgi:hypothetical protein